MNRKNWNLVSLGVGAFFVVLLFFYMLWKPVPLMVLFFMVLPVPVSAIGFLNSVWIYLNEDFSK